MELFSLMAKLTLDADDFMDKIDSAEDALNDIEDPDELTLGLDNSEFNDNINESTDKGSAFEQSMSTAFKNVGTALTGAGIVGALAGIVKSLKEAIDMTAETADGIDKGSKRLDISRKAYQEWDHALRQSGASINDLGKGIRNVQKLSASKDTLYNAFEQQEDIVDGLTDETVNLGKETTDAFKKLGIASRVASGELSGTEDIMKETLLALADYKGDDRSLLVRALFGNNADGLNALLNEGKSGVEELLSEAGDLGLIMDDEEIDNAVAYGDAVQNLQDELNAIKSAFVADIIPVLTDAVTAVTNFLAALNPRNRENGLQDTLDKIDAKALDAGKSLDDASEAAMQMINRLAGMGDYWTLDDEGKRTWNALAQEFIETYPQFSQFIGMENKEIKGNTDLINENIRAWADREKQRIVEQAYLEKQEEIRKMSAKALEQRVEAMKKEDEAERRRKDTISELNAELDKEISKYDEQAEKAKSEEQSAYYREQADNLRKSILGANADATDILHTQTALQQNAGKNYQEAQRIGHIADAYTTATEEADALNKKADEMQKQVDDAMAGLEEDQQQLIKLLNGTTTNADTAKATVEGLTKALNAVPSKVPVSFPIDSGFVKSHAIGSAYIPYDNYPALLHRGERVLTATEARQSGNVDLTGLEDRIASAIRNGMEGATVRSYINGRDITDEVNRNNINAVKERRFR